MELMRSLFCPVEGSSNQSPEPNLYPPLIQTVVKSSQYCQNSSNGIAAQRYCLNPSATEYTDQFYAHISRNSMVLAIFCSF